MKILIVLAYTLLSITCFRLDLLTKESLIKHQGLNNQIISPGRGYSSDRQQLSPIVCFNYKVSPYGKTESIVRLDQGYSYTQIQNTLKVDVSTKVSIGIFSVQAGAEYMKYIKDTDYSMSVNYYQFVQSEFMTEMGFGPAGALTADGLRAYGPVDKPNPRFGLICGDMFISSFKVGAQLIFSMKLQFNSHTEKQSFAVKFGASFGSFVSISTDIQKIVSQTNSSGSMTILAYQSGGNPAELAKILNSSCGSNYCAATCSMQKLTDCNSAINGLLSYAINKFPSQVNLQDVSTLSSFPLGFARLQSIKWLGLQIPPSYVTKDVLTMRQSLANRLLSNQYYLDAMTTLTKASLPWVKESNFYQHVNQLINVTKYNINQLVDLNSGGIACYEDLESCLQSGNNLVSRLKVINQTNLQNIIKVVKYKLKITPCELIYYKVGDGGSTSDWFTNTKSAACPNFKTNSFLQTYQVNLYYNVGTTYQNQANHTFTGYNLHSFQLDDPWSGQQIHDWPGGNRQIYNITIPKILSEYALQLYKE